MFTYAFMHHPYLVCILFGKPSLHLFTFLIYFLVYMTVSIYYKFVYTILDKLY